MTHHQDMDQLSRSITINGRRTSIRMEHSLWEALAEVADQEQTGLRDLIAMVDGIRGDHGLTASLRVFVVNYYRSVMAGQYATAMSNNHRRFVASPLVANVLSGISPNA